MPRSSTHHQKTNWMGYVGPDHEPRPFWRWWLFCLGCWAWFRFNSRAGLNLLGWAVHSSWVTPESYAAKEPTP